MQFKYKTNCDKRGSESRFIVVGKLWGLFEEELVPMGRAYKTSRRGTVESVQGQIDFHKQNGEMGQDWLGFLAVCWSS